jgi:hypothetical protein
VELEDGLAGRVAGDESRGSSEKRMISMETPWAGRVSKNRSRDEARGRRSG